MAKYGITPLRMLVAVLAVTSSMLSSLNLFATKSYGRIPKIHSHHHSPRHRIKVSNGKWLMKAHRNRG